MLEVQSGWLLLRGPNGTGKTTVLVMLWPYLLDLNAQRLPAGKARTTTLRSLMRERASGKRRFGYGWLTFAGPGSEGVHTYGVRLQFSEGPRRRSRCSRSPCRAGRSMIPPCTGRTVRH